jgi:hypothetical protein
MVQPRWFLLTSRIVYFRTIRVFLQLVGLVRLIASQKNKGSSKYNSSNLFKDKWCRYKYSPKVELIRTIVLEAFD